MGKHTGCLQKTVFHTRVNRSERLHMCCRGHPEGQWGRRWVIQKPRARQEPWNMLGIVDIYCFWATGVLLWWEALSFLAVRVKEETQTTRFSLLLIRRRTENLQHGTEVHSCGLNVYSLIKSFSCTSKLFFYVTAIRHRQIKCFVWVFGGIL